jgi:chromosomal replication initiator protein
MQVTKVEHDPWHRALAHTRTRSPATFEQWFASVGFGGLAGGRLDLVARDEFVRDWVKTHFQPTLVGHLEDAMSSPVEVVWTIDPILSQPICVASAPVRSALGSDSQADSGRPDSSRPDANRADSSRADSNRADSSRPESNRPDSNRPSRTSQPPQGASSRPSAVTSGVVGNLNAKYTFENFIVGSSNELAHAAAYACASGGTPRYNPLFITGGTGLGKTHLMHAIAHKVLSTRPSARIVYVSAEHFTNEFIEALQNHRMDEFRARYRSQCDLLLLDDVQFLAGREQTQEEFFHTFNALHDSLVPIVLTSDKYPQQLQRMPERLVSRFTSGLVADVQAPRLETRVAILKKKAQIEGIVLPDSVAVVLAQRIHSNVRELEGALIRLAAKASLTGRSVDEELMQSEVALVTSAAQRHVGVSDIQRAVCSHFRLTSADLMSKDRHKSVAFARQVAMYLCRQRLKSSFPELGRAFGNRDHTTVMSAVRRVESLRKRDPEVAAHLEAIERRLASSES